MQSESGLSKASKIGTSGYDAWLDWCETLYEPDAHYNVYSDRLTLQQYKDMMGQLFQAYDIELGEFHNMIVEGEWGCHPL